MLKLASHLGNTLLQLLKIQRLQCAIFISALILCACFYLPPTSSASQETSPTQLKQRQREAELLLDKANPRAAFQVANEVLQKDPGNATFLYLRAMANHKMKRREEAIVDFTASLKIKPDLQTYKDRAYTYKVLGDMHKSLADLQAMVRMSPNSDRIVDVAAMELEVGDIAACIRDAEKAVSMAKTSDSDWKARIAAYQLLGKAYIQKNDCQRALQALNNGAKALSTGVDGKKLNKEQIDKYAKGKFEDLFLLRGEAYEKSGKLKEAISDYEYIVSFHSKNTIVRRSLLRAYRKAGENNKALALVSQLLIEDDTPDLFYKRAEIYKKLGKPDLAKVDEQRARKIENDLMGKLRNE